MTFSNINYIWIVKLFDSINALSDSCLVDRLQCPGEPLDAYSREEKSSLSSPREPAWISEPSSSVGSHPSGLV